MSRTFSTKNGSVESLKWRCRCGSSPNACQMRCTVDFESRVWPAIWRTLQCVPSFGFVSNVLRTNCATRSSLIGRGRPGRNSSCNPDTPCSKNRCRHLPTVALVSPIWRAICRFVLPEALSKIILARLTSPAGRDRELARLSSCSCCSGRKTNCAFGRPIAIGTPILHWRYPYSRNSIAIYLWDSTLAERSPPMSIGPRQRQDDCEDQSIGRNVQIKVGQAVYQDCRNTPDATERCGLVETLLSVPVVPDGLGEDPEDRAKNQQPSGKTEFADDLQVVAVRVFNKEVAKSGLNRGIGHGE